MHCPTRFLHATTSALGLLFSALWFTYTEYAGAAVRGDQIGRISPTGTLRWFPLGDSSEPDGITTGPDRAMWFTLGLSNKIGRLHLGK